MEEGEKGEEEDRVGRGRESHKNQLTMPNVYKMLPLDYVFFFGERNKVAILQILGTTLGK